MKTNKQQTITKSELKNLFKDIESGEITAEEAVQHITAELLPPDQYDN